MLASGRPNNQVFGIRLSTLTKSEIVDRLLAAPSPGMGVRLVATANLAHIVTLRKDRAFRDSYSRAWLVTADGAPIFAYARLVGLPIPERVTGVDLVDMLADRLSPEHHRLFFVASTALVAGCIAAKFIARGFRRDQIACAVPPRGFEQSLAEADALAELVKRHKPTHLIIGIGAPPGQTWLDRCGDELGDVYALCIGAAIEFHLALKRRAPLRLSRLGLEWLWRVAKEPRRLASRYFVMSWGFVPAVIADLVTRGERSRL
jgi:N-acetylglucosaminyldiphosphoundecaprenol N-acetyl-beta-D-mannosaminyltransferase